jgi:hypothetical protein
MTNEDRQKRIEEKVSNVLHMVVKCLHFIIRKNSYLNKYIILRITILGIGRAFVFT